MASTEEFIDKMKSTIANLVARIKDGLTWAEVAESLLDIVRLASVLVDSLPQTNEAKKALVVEWSLKAFDAAAAALTVSVATWWMIPLFSAARMLLVHFLPGVVEFIYQQLVKE